MAHLELTPDGRALVDGIDRTAAIARNGARTALRDNPGPRTAAEVRKLAAFGSEEGARKALDSLVERGEAVATTCGYSLVELPPLAKLAALVADMHPDQQAEAIKEIAAAQELALAGGEAVH